MSSQSAEYDVIILGGGIVGVSTAYVLAGRGLDVLLLERYEPAHERGSSHGDSRMIRFDYEEPVYVEMATLAFRAWEKIAIRLGQPVLKQTGICNLAPSNSEVLATLEHGLREYELPFERLTSLNFTQRFPQFNLPRTSEVIFQPDSAVLFADEVVRNLWRCVQEDGVDILPETEVDSIDLSTKNILVKSVDGRSWSGAHLVLTAGGWMGRWLESLDIDVPLVVTRELLAYFSQTGSCEHKMGVMPNCIDYHTADPFYCVPQVRVHGVKAGHHRTGRTVDPDDPVEVDTGNLSAVKNFISRRFPYLSPEPIAVHHCLYTNSADYHFILDRHSHFDNVVFAAGFSGHGFKFGPVLGEVLAGLLLNEELPVDTSLFSLERFQHSEAVKPRTIA